MTEAAVFVDLPNFYGQLLKSGLGPPQFIRDYLLTWLDFDLLAKNLTGYYSDVWVFYSGGRLGPSDARIDGSFLNEYIRRINALRGVTARDVNIPGEQREAFAVRCENCGEETVAQWKSEKGVDASLTVHLFDTMDSWNRAILLSGDADFVPVVASLRRRGKVVVGCGFAAASSALVRECYEYIDLPERFIRRDMAAFTLFRPDGAVEKWLTPAQPRNEPSSPKLELTLSCGRQSEAPFDYDVSLCATGPYDFTNWRAEVQERLRELCFKASWSPAKRSSAISAESRCFNLVLGETNWEGVQRRLDLLISRIDGVQSSAAKNYYRVEYQYNHDTKRYKPIIPTGGKSS